MGPLDDSGPAQPVYVLPSAYLTNVSIAVSSFDSPYLPDCYRVELDSPYAALGLQGEDSLTLATLAALRGEDIDEDEVEGGGSGSRPPGDLEQGGAAGHRSADAAAAAATSGASAARRRARDGGSSGGGGAVTWKSAPTARERAIAERQFPSRPWAEVPAAIAAAAATAVEIEARRERLYGAAAPPPPRPRGPPPAPQTARRRPAWR